MLSKDFKHTVFIIVVFIAACMETDIYLPAFADMMHYFHVNEDQVQSLLTWNFLGICLSGPFYGPISDAIGRKKPLCLALLLFFIGSLFTVFAETFQLMLIGRLLQGIGSGGCFTLGTAIIFDLFPGDRSVAALSKINATCPFIMALAPMLGGYLNHVYGFRSNFIAIALFVLISLVSLLFFDEPHPVAKRQPLEIKKLAADFRRAATTFDFWRLSTAVSLLNAGYLVFLSTSSILFVVSFGISKVAFCYYQGALLLSWLVASVTAGSQLKTKGPQKIKRQGMLAVVIGALSFTLISLLFPQNAILLTGCMMVFAFGVNWAQGIYFPEGMQLLSDCKGIAASLLTSLRLLLTAFIVGLSGTFYDGTTCPLMYLIVACVAITLLAIIPYERKLVSSKSGT